MVYRVILGLGTMTKRGFASHREPAAEKTRHKRMERERRVKEGEIVPV